MIDLLHVFTIIQQLEHLVEQLGVIAADFGMDLRNEADLIDFEVEVFTVDVGQRTLGLEVLGRRRENRDDAVAIHGRHELT